MDRLDFDSAVIGGMSMGGPVALPMYEQAPDRFEGFVLMDTTAAAAAPPEAGLWQGATGRRVSRAFTSSRPRRASLWLLAAREAGGMDGLGQAPGPRMAAKLENSALDQSISPP
jgi:pimeloyl-ACP methyl ester carboxylesterase